MSTGQGDYKLGLIIPTREEFGYLQKSIPFTPILNDEKGFWYEFRMPGGRLGVAHVLFDMGLTVTTSAAVRLLERFNPEVLAVVGIGGALSTELRLGDVVIGSVIQEYLKAAKVASDVKKHMAFQPAGDGWPLAERLRNFTNHFQYFAEDSYKSWVRFAKIRGVEANLPFATTPGARREPEYFVMPIASGDLLITDPAFSDWVLSHDRKRAVIEMEGAGAARAVKEYDRDVALLVLRGISDFADERKAALDGVVSGQTSGAWRRYAAQNAVELLYAFLSSPRFPWRTSAPPTTDRPDGDVPSAGYVPSGGTAAPSAQQPYRAWDYFMQAAHLVEATAAGLEILNAWRSSHPQTDSEHHESNIGGDHGHNSRHDHAHDHGHSHDSAVQDHGAAHEPGEYYDTGYHDTTHHDVSHDVPVEHDWHSDAHPPPTDPHHY